MVREKLRCDSPPQFTGSRTYDPRGIMMQIAAVRARVWGLKMRPRSRKRAMHDRQRRKPPPPFGAPRSFGPQITTIWFLMVYVRFWGYLCVLGAATRLRPAICDTRAPTMRISTPFLGRLRNLIRRARQWATGRRAGSEISGAILGRARWPVLAGRNPPTWSGPRYLPSRLRGRPQSPDENLLTREQIATGTSAPASPKF